MKKTKKKSCITKKIRIDFFLFVKKTENPDLAFQRVGSKSGTLSTDINKSKNTNYFLKLINNLALNIFVQEYKKKIHFLHNNTIGIKSISKQELIKQTNEELFQ